MVEAVRADLDAYDVLALLSAAAVAEKRDGPSGQPGRLASMIAEALRPSPATEATAWSRSYRVWGRAVAPAVQQTARPQEQEWSGVSAS